MSETSLVPDVIKSTSDAVQANLPETAKQTDGILSTVVGFFNNVVFYPVKRANLTFKYKLESFEEDLKKKVEKIPAENLQIPPTMIAGPTLEALRYAYDEEELREMYENLLASAMNREKVKKVHPAYVDAIRQMTSLDAIILNYMAKKFRIACANIVFSFSRSGKVLLAGMPDYFSCDLFDIADPFDVSASLQNICRLGLVDIESGKMNNYDYSAIKEFPYVVERYQLACKGEAEKPTIVQRDFHITLSDYGRNFTEVCLRPEVPNNAD